MQYNFYYNNRRAANGISLALKKLADADRPPIFVCVGSDLISGDSLGPITGSMLKTKIALPQAVILGNLEKTITAKEIKYLAPFLKDTFPTRPIVTVDAAVGDMSDVGVIKVSDAPLSPGSGVNKRLGKIGDVSVQGVVAEKNILSANALAEVRMKMVYKMSDIISDAIADFFAAHDLAL